MQFPQLIKNYAIVVTEYWLTKFKYNFHGQNRGKDLIAKLSKLKSSDTDESQRMRLSTDFGLFWKQGETFWKRQESTPSAGDRHYLFAYKPSGLTTSSLRGLLISLITPNFDPKTIAAKESNDITAEIESMFQTMETDVQYRHFIEKKAGLLKFLNTYIGTHSVAWNKMHGVSRAFELAEILIKCTNERDINIALVKFIHTGKVGSDFSALNIHSPSGFDESSLRGGLIKYLFEDKAEKTKLLHVPTPQFGPIKTTAKVTPIMTETLTVPVTTDVVVAAPTASEKLTTFKNDFNNFTAAGIANKLFEMDYDGGLEDDMEEQSSWWCMPSLRRMFGYS